jgi:hypothetical protein
VAEPGRARPPRRHASAATGQVVDATAMVRRLRWQAAACREMGSPLYAFLLDHVAADVLDGGPCLDALSGHEDDPGPSALALRLMGAVHRLVLEGRAPGLANYYLSAGGTMDGDGSWPAFRSVVREHRDELRRLLDRPPQTNEVGRAASLIGGLLHVVDQWSGPVRLFEIGASAGLNLRADSFRVELADGTGVGPVGSPVVLSDPWLGQRPPDVALHVVERRGCDTEPVDPATEEGRLRLTSFVWPDQLARLERLRGALEIAARVPAPVVRQTARDFVQDLQLEPGTTTVLWHSIMWQYLEEQERSDVEARLDELGEAADTDARLAHLALEPRRRTPSSGHEVLVVLRMWPGGEERILGSAAAHGIPTTWD